MLNHVRHVASPYTLSIPQQVMICVERGFQRLRGDASVTISRVVANGVLALVVGKSSRTRILYLLIIEGSMFYNLSQTTTSFYGRSVCIFLAILLNAFASALEVRTVCIDSVIANRKDSHSLRSTPNRRETCSICSLPPVCGGHRVNNLRYAVQDRKLHLLQPDPIVCALLSCQSIRL